MASTSTLSVGGGQSLRKNTAADGSAATARAEAPTSADDCARFGRRSAGRTFAGREEIVANALGEAFGILTVRVGFEAGALHALHSLEGVFPVCEYVRSICRQNTTFSSKSTALQHFSSY